MRRIRPFIRKAELFGQTETTLFPTLPNHLYADIFIDSQATIAAIKEKPLSERRRISRSGVENLYSEWNEREDSTGPNPPHMKEWRACPNEEMTPQIRCRKNI